MGLWHFNFYAVVLFSLLAPKGHANGAPLPQVVLGLPVTARSPRRLAAGLTQPWRARAVTGRAGRLGGGARRGVPRCRGYSRCAAA